MGSVLLMAGEAEVDGGAHVCTEHGAGGSLRRSVGHCRCRLRASPCQCWRGRRRGRSRRGRGRPAPPPPARRRAPPAPTRAPAGKPATSRGSDHALQAASSGPERGWVAVLLVVCECLWVARARNGVSCSIKPRFQSLAPLSKPRFQSTSQSRLRAHERGRRSSVHEMGAAAPAATIDTIGTPHADTARPTADKARPSGSPTSAIGPKQNGGRARSGPAASRTAWKRRRRRLQRSTAKTIAPSTRHLQTPCLPSAPTPPVSASPFAPPSREL